MLVIIMTVQSSIIGESKSKHEDHSNNHKFRSKIGDPGLPRKLPTSVQQGGSIGSGRLSIGMPMRRSRSMDDSELTLGSSQKTSLIESIPTLTDQQITEAIKIDIVESQPEEEPRTIEDIQDHTEQVAVLNLELQGESPEMITAELKSLSMNQETIQEVVTEEQIEHRENEVMGNQVSDKVDFQGFKGVCDRTIKNAQPFLIDYIANQFYGFDTVKDEAMYLDMFDKLTLHSEQLLAYTAKVKDYGPLVNLMTIAYVPVRLKKLLTAMLESMGLKFAAKVSINEESNAKLARYIEMWEAGNIDYQKYNEFGSVFYSELSGQSSDQYLADIQAKINTKKTAGDTDKDADEAGQISAMRAAFFDMTVANPGYKANLIALNEEVCRVQKEIIFTMAGEAGRMTRFASTFEETDPKKKTVHSTEFHQFSLAFFTAFYQTLTEFLPANCPGADPKDTTKTIREMIFFAKTNMLYSEPSISELKITIEITNTVWTSFFGLFKGTSGTLEQYSEYYAYLLNPEFETAEDLWEKMLYFRDKTNVMHPEFFNLLANMKIEGIDASVNIKSIKITDMQWYFENVSESAKDGVNDKEFQVYMTYRNVIIHMYKIYIFLNEKGKFPEKAGIKDIITQFCQFWEDKTYFASADGEPELFNTLFIKEEFSAISISLSSHIAFLAKSLGIDKCIPTGSNLITIEPSLDPPSPIIHPDIKVIIIAIKLTLVKVTYRKKLIEAAWTTAKCADGKTQRFDLTKYNANKKKVVRKAFVDVETENSGKTKKIPHEFLSERTIKRFTTDCLSENIIIFKAILEKDGFEEFKKAKVPNYVVEIVKITIEVIFTKSYEIRGLLWHVLVKYFKDLTTVSEDQKLFMVLLFQYLEKRVVSQLDLYETYGVFGFTHSIYDRKILNDIVRKRKGVHQDHNHSFEGLFKLDKISQFKFIVDLYYLTYVAGRVTAPKVDVELPEKEFINKRNLAEQQLPSLIDYITRVRNAKEVEALKPFTWNFQGLEEQIGYCRRWKYFTNSATEKKEVLVDKYRAFVEGKADKTVKREQNDYVKCSTNFLKQIISELHTLPILLYSVPVFYGYNYLHEYFRVDSTEFIVEDILPLSKMYRHLQLIRLNSDVQMSDIPNYILDKTSNCIENVKWNKNNNPNYDCYFSPKEYANFYWLFKFAFNVNYPHIHYDFKFFDDKVPIFGTTMLMMTALEHKLVNRDMKVICEEIDIEEEEPNICKMFMILSEFADKFEASEDPEPDTEELFTALNNLAEKETNENGKIQFRFLVLEAFKVIFNMNSKYAEVAERIKTDLSVDNLIFSGQKSEERKAIRDSPIYDRFIVRDNEKEAITVHGQYLYYTNIKRKYSMEEKVFRKSIKMLLENKPDDIIKLLSYDGHKAPDFFKYVMIYSPSPAMSTIIASCMSTMRVFLSSASLKISKHEAERFVVESQASCDKTPLECFIAFIVGDGIAENVNDLEVEFEFDSEVSVDHIDLGLGKLTGEEFVFTEHTFAEREFGTIEFDQKMVTTKQTSSTTQIDYTYTEETRVSIGTEFVGQVKGDVEIYRENLSYEFVEDTNGEEALEEIPEDAIRETKLDMDENVKVQAIAGMYLEISNLSADMSDNARIGSGNEAGNSFSMGLESFNQAIELGKEGSTSPETILSQLGKGSIDLTEGFN